MRQYVCILPPSNVATVAGYQTHDLGLGSEKA